MHGLDSSTIGVIVPESRRTRHLTEGELAGWLDDRLDADERKRVERHLDACQECRHELAETTRLIEGVPRAAIGFAPDAASPPHTAPATMPHLMRRPARRPLRRWAGALAGLAAAAAVAIVAVRQAPPTVEPHVRAATGVEGMAVGEGERRIAVLAPADAAVGAGQPVVLRWSAAGSVTYRVTVQAENGAPIWRGTTGDTVLTLPDTVRLRPGAYFWRVEAASAGVVLGSGRQRFEVRP